MRYAISLLLLTLLPALGAAHPSSPDGGGTTPGQGSFVAMDAFEQVKQMGRGVNIIGYDPLWKDFAKARFKERHFERIHDAGFQTVRVVLQAFSHMDAENKLDVTWLHTLNWAVKTALANHLNVILDEHDYNRCATDAAACREKVLAFWSQVAPRYRDAPASVIFEILNEPNRALTPPLWNGLLKDALAVIRQTNPSRNVIVGPAFWNNIRYLDQLELPAADRHLIVTVHYYLPMRFTHQGASWVKETANLSGITWGSDEEKQKLEDDFAGVQAWSKKEDRPIFLGEFGAYDKAGMDSRVLYISTIARTAERLGWAWAYWQFEGDFIVYDVKADDWVQPILKALVPDGSGKASSTSTAITPTAVAFPLSTKSRFIVDANGSRVRLKAFNWYGAESPDGVVGGLAYQSLYTIVAELHQWGFNAVRLLWSNQIVETNPIVKSKAVAAEPDMVGMHALDALDRVVATLAANHMMVILDNHVSHAIWCCSNTDGDGLWYSSAYPESSWIADWQMMAKRYAGQPYVMGADLRNELRCQPANGKSLCATWGGDASTDWHAAAERGGNAVLAANPNLLVFVEGPAYDTDLSGISALPIVFRSNGHLVYEAHDYGFAYSSKPLTGAADWINRITPRWGYLVTGANPQPLWIGEFGTCNTAEKCVASSKSKDLGFWFQIITQYMEANQLDWCYWPANGTYSNYPNARKTHRSVEGYGILNTKWNAPSRPSLLNTLQGIMK